MNIRAVLLLLVPVALAAQAPTAANFRRFPSAALAKRIPVGSPKARAKAFVRPGDDLVPQIANGELDGGHIFFTIFRIMNITDFPADVFISYFDANGDPLSGPPTATAFGCWPGVLDGSCGPLGAAVDNVVFSFHGGSPFGFSASDSRSCRPKAATAMNSRVGRLGGHSHDSRNLTFLFRSREATTHRVYLNEVDTPQTGI